MKHLFILALFLVVFSPLRAQVGVRAETAGSDLNNKRIQSLESDTIRTYHLPEVLITATRLERNAFEVGRSATVVPLSAITSSLYQNVGEVLAEQQGVYLVGVGQNPGMIQSIFMRGASSNQTAIMIDDVRVTDPSGVNSALDLSELSFAGLERIEIVRGSHSTLYGSSAIGGVVNLITQKDRSPGLHVEAEMRGGVFGKGTSTFSQYGSMNYTSPVGLYIAADFRNSVVKGLDATVDSVTDLGSYKNRDRDGFDQRTLWSKVGYKNRDTDLYFSWNNTRQRTDLDKTAYIDDDNYTLEFHRNLLSYGASTRITDAISLRLIGGYSDMNRLAVDDSSVVDAFGTSDHTYSRGEWHGTTLTNEVYGAFQFPAVQAVAGVNWYNERMSSKSYFYTRGFYGEFELGSDLDSLDLYTTTVSAFGHVDLNGSLLRENLGGLSLALGARLNSHSTFGSHMTYEVSPSLRIYEGARVYASYSTGFNAPSLYQLFAPERDFTSGITRGNSDLRPEQSKSFEVGFKQATGSIDFSLSFFHTVVENSIEYVYLWNGNVGIDTLGNDWLRNDFRGDAYLNVGRQTTSGVEFGVSSQIGRRFWLSGNLSLVSGRLSYRPSQLRGEHARGNHVQVYGNGAFLNTAVETSGLVRRPSTANICVTYKPTESLLLKLDLRYVGPRTDVYYDSKRGPYGALGTVPVTEYTLVDISQRIMLSDSFFIHARVENVFDTKYSEINGFTTRGRGFYLGVRYAFSSPI